MKDSETRKGARQDEHRNKKPTGWPDYFDWMVRYARTRVPESAADEVANDALFDAYRSDKPKPRIDDVSEVRRWLSCFIIWRALRHHRREQNVKLWDSYDFDSHDERDEFGTTIHSEGIIDRLELSEILAELSLEDRTILLAYHANGFTASELAAQKGVSEKSIRKQVEKAKASFVKVYERRQRTEARGFWFMPLSNNEVLHDVFAHLRRVWHELTPGARFAAIGATCIAVVVVPSDVAGSPAVVPETMKNGSVVNEYQPETEIAVEKSIVLQAKMLDSEMLALAVGPNVPSTQGNNKNGKSTAVVTKGPMAGSVTEPHMTTKNPIPPEVAPIALEANRSASECRIAFGEATTAFRFLDDSRACLAQLNMVPSDGKPCSESAPRMALRALCEAGLVKK